jgi:hypothetical protein
MKKCVYAVLMFAVFTAPALAGVSISSPAAGDQVSSPFYLSAHATSCSSQPISSIGYSLDNSYYTKILHGSSSIDTNVTSSTGTHTVHVKAWNIKGAVCVADVAVTVTNVISPIAADTSVTSSNTGGISVSTPSSAQTVSSPFSLLASATSCSSQPVRSMGYSLDNSSSTTILKGSTSIDAKVSASAGTHTVHVKAWNILGAVCSDAVAVTVSEVTDDVAADTAIVPLGAISISNIEALTNWKAAHDTGTNGTSSGTMSMVSSPSQDGSARGFVTAYTSNGGERYSVTFGDDTTSTNFLYDAWVYFTASSSNIANLEMDVNQTMPNGQTVIFGVQCDGYSGTWDYSENLGTPQKPAGHWAHSQAACNPRNLSTNTWHHVQISYSRNDSGMVTYNAVYLDGIKSALNATVLAARALGWGTSLSTNFQIDGLGLSGSSTLYLDKLTIYRW